MRESFALRRASVAPRRTMTTASSTPPEFEAVFRATFDQVTRYVARRVRVPADVADVVASTYEESLGACIGTTRDGGITSPGCLASRGTSCHTTPVAGSTKVPSPSGSRAKPCSRRMSSSRSRG